MSAGLQSNTTGRGKTIIQPEELKQTLRDMGYRCRFKATSQFTQVSVFCGDAQVNGGNVMTPEHRNKYANYYDWINTVSVQDETGWRYIA